MSPDSNQQYKPNSLEEHMKAAEANATGNRAIVFRALVESNMAQAEDHLQRIIEISDEIKALNQRVIDEKRFDQGTLDLVNRTVGSRVEKAHQLADRARLALVELEKYRLGQSSSNK